MNEQFSQWLDGELDDEEWQAVLAQAAQQDGLREKWQAYHLIGDTLRGTAATSAGFHEHFAARLAQEPTILAPAELPRKQRWQWGVSIAASLAGFIAVAIGAGQMLLHPSDPASPSMLVAQQDATLPSDYMQAHQQLASHGEPITQPVLIAYETSPRR